MKVSIIIVHYSAKKALFDCLDSIYKSKPNVSFETIIVDNDEKKKIKKELIKKFSWIKYIKSEKNRGFGFGNNLGAKNAKGELLFFLNPDTKIFKDSIDNLVTFVEKNKTAGIAAPLLLDAKNKPYEFQGTNELTPIKAVFALSFINKIFPENLISKKYWLYWNKKSPKEVDVVPGTALMIRKNLFEKIGGFDERFFLYFEEFDLCRQVKKLGFKIFIDTSSKVLHLWGESTKKVNNIDEIFTKSRFLYFKKNFGIVPAFIVQIILSINKTNLFIIGILAIGVFLRFFKLSELMMFIGDQGWFYLSARDMLLTGKIPLVGITASHTWLHQGPLWTYLLSLVLFFSKFNPVSGAYFTSFFGIITVWLMYKVGSVLFSKRLGLIAAALFATSPLVVIHSRMAYHTSLIPLFVTILIFCLYKWIKGNTKAFPLIIFLLAVLYNLELATVVFAGVVLLIFFYGIFKKKIWVRLIMEKKIIFSSILLMFLAMFPIFLYDIGHGFTQTIKFAAWIPYRLLKIFSGGLDPSFFSGSALQFFSLFIERLIFPTNKIIAFLIFSLSIGVLIYSIFLEKKLKHNFVLIFLLAIVIFIGLVINPPSEAYLPMSFPIVILFTGLLFDRMINIKLFKIPTFIILLLILLLNSSFLISKNYLMDVNNGYGPAFSERLKIAEYIVRSANGKKYNLLGREQGSQFESFSMNYEYLTWWLGNPPSKSNEKLKYVVSENEKINIIKIEK